VQCACLRTGMCMGLSVMPFALSVICLNLVAVALWLCCQNDAIVNRYILVGTFLVLVSLLLEFCCSVICIFYNVCLISAGTHLCLFVYSLNMLLVLCCFWQVIQSQYYAGHNCKMYCVYRVNYGT